MMEQISLLDWKPRGPYITEPDIARLKGQMRRVYDCLSDGKARTLQQISDETGDPPASVSARFRDLGHMGFPTAKENLGRGLWMYWLKGAVT